VLLLPGWTLIGYPEAMRLPYMSIHLMGNELLRDKPRVIKNKKRYKAFAAIFGVWACGAIASHQAISITQQEQFLNTGAGANLLLYALKPIQR
jgi:hypothetical protein